MKQQFLLLLTFFILNNTFAQEEINKELFFIGYGQAFSIEDQTLAFNGRIGLPMQQGFDFNFQFTYVPDIMDFGYKEFRYLFNVELTLFSIRKFSFYGIAGLDYGYWKRTWTGPFTPIYDSYIKDNSLVFGGGINYSFGRFEIFGENKTYWGINQNHAALGLRYKIFENADLRERYYNYQKSKLRRSKTGTQ